MLTCPICHSEDIRRSHRTNLYVLINRWRGLRRYRCRECRKIFYRPLSPFERASHEPSEHQPPSEPRKPFGLRKGSQRLLIEFLLFATMVAVFYFVLKALRIQF